MDKASFVTPESLGKLKSIEGTSLTGKYSLNTSPFPIASTFHEIEVPNPVPYTFLFLY